MSLPTVWFCLIALLWSGYFLLEGFDFGVGMLLPVLPRRGNDEERGVMFESIGPVWDGNEVWLVVAAGATFAAFPQWYATLFSGLYIAVLLILVLLILRVVSFEWRERSDGSGWRRSWMWANTLGSVGVPFLWALVLANLLHGLPLNSSHDFTGDFFDLFSGYTVLAGIAAVSVFALHGATYLTVRVAGDLRERALAASQRLALPALALMVAFAAWTVTVAHDRNARGIVPTLVPAALSVAAILGAAILSHTRRSGWAFAMTGLGAIGMVATIFTGLYPRVLVSQPGFSNSLTVSGAAAGHYPLQVITIVAAIFMPIVLLYQGWTYYVFRQRIGARRVRTPLATIAGGSGSRRPG